MLNSVFLTTIKPPCKRNWDALNQETQTKNLKFKENYNEMFQKNTVNDNNPSNNLQAKYNAFVNSLSKTGQETLPTKPRLQTTNPAPPQSEIVKDTRKTKLK